MKILQTLFLSLVFTFAATGQSTGNTVLRELLDLPSPPARREEQQDEEADRKRPKDFYDVAKPPADDSPIEDLVDYWGAMRGRFFSDSDQPGMTEATALRLLEDTSNKPQTLLNYLPFVPATESVEKRVERAYNAGIGNTDLADSWRDEVTKWLKLNTRVYMQELESDATRARDHKEYSSVVKEEELRALARVDWEVGQPLLERLSKDPSNPRTAALALALLYEHAVSSKDVRQDELRTALKQIVQDKKAPGRARDQATDALR